MISTPAIGVDVGGTSVKAVVADESGRVVGEARLPTPSPDPRGQGVVETVARVVAMIDTPDAPRIGVVVPGIVDETRGIAVHSVNLGWSDLPLAAMLTNRLDRPIAFGHDVRAGALAETRWGAASDELGVVVFVAIGTGVAAAVLLDGHPVVSGGWAGEIGQLRLSAGPFGGSRLEEVASASATARRASLPDAKSVAERVNAGDERARLVWADTVDALADGLASVTATISPTTVVVGGGLALAGATLTDPLTHALTDRLGPLRPPRIVTARLGDRAAALGASLLARETS